MPETAYILAHDVGTSGTKSSIVRPDGTMLGSQTTPHQTHFPHPHWAEQEPADWWSGVLRNTHSLVERFPEARRKIAGIGVSGHMLGCVLVDSDGQAVRRAMIHSDTRATAQCEAIGRRIGADRIYRTTGNRLDPRSGLCKVLWVKDNEPQLYARAARLLQSKDYMVSRLTGVIDTTDMSDASHGGYFDVNTLAYPVGIFDDLGLSRQKFPTVRPGIAVVGKLSAAAAEALDLPSGIPVVAGGGDGACATVGSGVVSPGDAYCCMGTTAWISAVREKPTIDPQARIFNITAVDGRTCGVYGTVQSAGSALAWAMNLFGESDYAKLEEYLAAVSPGSGGLVFLPYLEGERSPIWDANARGTFFGLAPTHDRKHILRATIEGVSFALRSVLEIFRESSSYPEIRLIGGGARSAGFRQIFCNVCRVEGSLLSVPAEDATSLGAAITAGVGVGVFRTVAEGVQAIRVTGRVGPDAPQAARYDEIYKLYATLYPSLRSAYALRASMFDQKSQ